RFFCTRLWRQQVLAPHAVNARTALTHAGASRDQIEQLLGGVLVEEAFTGEDPTEFDRVERARGAPPTAHGASSPTSDPRPTRFESERAPLDSACNVVRLGP